MLNVFCRQTANFIITITIDTITSEAMVIPLTKYVDVNSFQLSLANDLIVIIILTRLNSSCVIKQMQFSLRGCIPCSGTCYWIFGLLMCSKSWIYCLWDWGTLGPSSIGFQYPQSQVRGKWFYLSLKQMVFYYQL